MKYVIPEIPPSNNRYIGRTNFREYQRMKSHWEELILYTCLPRPKAPIRKATVRIVYYFPDHRRRDPDNYSGKMILDGLVRAGILADDSFANIHLELEGRHDKNNRRTEIEVEEQDETE